MLEFVGLLITGVAVGTYAGAVGAGGGFLLTPILLARYSDAQPDEITTATLSGVAIASASSSLAAARRRRLDRPVAALLIGAAIPPALLGAAATSLLPRSWFALGFALMLVATGLWLAWRPVARIVAPVSGGWRREVNDGAGATFVYRIPVVRSALAAATAAGLSTLAGIGGGLLYAPLATRVMRIPHALAVPVAQTLITAVATSAVALHFAAGHAADPLDDVPPLAIGVVASIPLARLVHDRLGEGPLTRALAAGLLIVGIRTAFLAL